MLSLSLLTVVGLVVVAATDPHDFSRLCSSPAPGGECPAGWRNVGGDCLKFMSGWDQAKAKEVCREERAEYIEFLFLPPVCLVRRETQCQCGRTNIETKTAFGVEIEKEEYPWEVRLSTSRDPSITCGGSIINRDEILTAANCTEGQSVESITVFTKTDEQHSVCSKREHPDEDLAVLTLCKPLMFSQAVGPVCLPEPVQEKDARLILARLTTSILSTTICNEDRDGSPLAVLGEDGRYTQMGVGCTEPGDTWFYIKYSSLKSWINFSPGPVLLISGGYNSFPRGPSPPGEKGPTNEMFDPVTKTVKKMPSLPSPGRGFLSLDSNLACGGMTTDTTCDVWNGREWERAAVELNHPRDLHVSWPRHDGVLLMGGRRVYNTELVTWDGKNTTNGFSLEYMIMQSCGIPDQETDTIIITGGYPAQTRVSQYNRNGLVKNLPSLNTGRASHGCAQFTDNGVKVLLVTGGGDGPEGSFSSTEILRMDSSSNTWTTVGDLPLPLQGLRGATLGNVVYMTGGAERVRRTYAPAELNFRSLILRYDMKSRTWETVANMTSTRWGHAVTVLE